MGILDFVFGKTPSIEDEFFGKMLFMEFKKNPKNNYFECRRHFKPTDDEIEIGISGNLSGPIAAQKDFFRNIETNYDELIKAVKPMIENEFRNWQKDFAISDFRKEFKAVYLKLPPCKKNPIVWEIAFETVHDENHTVTVRMKDFTAEEILIDG